MIIRLSSFLFIYLNFPQTFATALIISFIKVHFIPSSRVESRDWINILNDKLLRVAHNLASSSYISKSSTFLISGFIFEIVFDIVLHFTDFSTTNERSKLFA
jgi:hypothetical protein